MSETKHGFPAGRVAQTLRQIINHDLAQKDIETISVVLYSHLLIDDRLSEILYYLLTSDLPEMGGGKTESERKELESKHREMKNELWKKASGTTFLRKLEYIEPCLKIWFAGLPTRIREINNVRNDIFHARKKMEEVIFEGASIWAEEGVEKYFLAAQAISKHLCVFHELIDSRQAQMEKWGKRLQELGEALS